MQKLDLMSKTVDNKLDNIQKKLDTTESKVENTELKIEQTLGTIQKQLEHNEKRICGIERKIDDITETAEMAMVKANVTGKEVQELKVSVTFKQSEMDVLKTEVKNMKEGIKHIANNSTQRTHVCDSGKIQSENQVLSQKIENLENYSRRNNIVIEGLREPERENPHQAAAFIFHALHMPIPSYERCHRLGKPSPHKPRPLIIRLTHFRDKVSMFRNTVQLSGNAKGLRFADDLAHETKKKQTELFPALMYAKKLDKKARFVNDKILYRGKLYGKDNLKSMPGIDIQKACCLKGNGMTIFSGELCPLSNLYSVVFDVNGEKFQSTEHFYQVKKCEDYGEMELAGEIRAVTTPREAMFIGKQIRPDDTWLRSKGDKIMREGIKHKFSVPEMRDFLIQTTGFLGEATRHNYWGIGHNLHTNGAQNINNWNGSNTLGKILVDIRKELKG
jgi:hypothetical protein